MQIPLKVECVIFGLKCDSLLKFNISPITIFNNVYSQYDKSNLVLLHLKQFSNIKK